MNPHSMVLLLLVILGGVPLIILIYYGARLALRFLYRPARHDSGRAGEIGSVSRIHSRR